MINDITTDLENGMKKAVDSFKRDLQKIRTGRANAVASMTSRSWRSASVNVTVW